MFKFKGLSNYILLMQNMYLLVFIITEQIKMIGNVFTLNIHYKIYSKYYKTSVLNTRFYSQLTTENPFRSFFVVLMKA